MKARCAISLTVVAVVSAVTLAGAGPATAGESASEEGPVKSAEKAETVEKAEGAEKPAPKPKPAPPAVEVHGRLDLKYVLRQERGEDRDGFRSSDQDFYGFGLVEARAFGNVRLEASGRVDLDIDGQETPATFQSIDDTYSENFHGYLYTAFIEATDLGPLALARGGRQRYEHGIDVVFDGGRLDLQPLGNDKLTLSGWGGVPAHYYESSHSGDCIVGGAVEVKPWEGGSARFDYVHVTDRRELPTEQIRLLDNEDQPLRDDDYFRVAVQQRLFRALALTAAVSTFEGRSTRIETQALFFHEDLDLTGRLSYTFQVGAYRLLSIDFTPLDSVLDEYKPYHELTASLTKGFADVVYLTGGVHVRQLDRESDEGSFNHEFERYYATFALVDWPIEGFEATVTGDHYRAEPDDDRYYTVSGEIGQQLPYELSIAGGSSYELYRFDEFFLEEREEVRTYYVRGAWKPVKGVELHVAYEREVDDEDAYDTWRLGARFGF